MNSNDIKTPDAPGEWATNETASAWEAGFESGVAAAIAKMPQQVPMFDDDVRELCVILGWQGGTIHQVKERVASLVKLFKAASKIQNTINIRGVNEFEKTAIADFGQAIDKVRGGAK